MTSYNNLNHTESLIKELFCNKYINDTLFNKLIKKGNQLIKSNDVISNSFKQFNKNYDFIKYEIIKYMFYDDFLKKEKKNKKFDKINFRFLSNSSIMHICFQILAQLESADLYNYFYNYIVEEYVFNKIKNELKFDSNVFKKSYDILNSLSKEEINEKCSISKDEINNRIKIKINNMKKELIEDIFDIYNTNNGNILLYNMSYTKKELENLKKNYPLIMSCKTTLLDNKDKSQLVITKDANYSINTKCINNKTEIWKLFSAVILHCDEQLSYIRSKNIKYLNNSIKTLQNTMNRFCKIIYNKNITEFVPKLNKPCRSNNVPIKTITSFGKPKNYPKLIGGGKV